MLMIFGLAYDRLRDVCSQSHSTDPPFRIPDHDGRITFAELVSAGCRIWASNHLVGDERQQEESCEQVEGEMGVEP